MKLYGVSVNGLNTALVKTNRQYNGNLALQGVEERKGYIAFRLRVKNSKNKGHRIGQGGRLVASACWHAHKDFMAELFKRHPFARLVTMRAVYNGKEDFEAKAWNTGHDVICQGVEYVNACEC